MRVDTRRAPMLDNNEVHKQEVRTVQGYAVVEFRMGIHAMDWVTQLSTGVADGGPIGKYMATRRSADNGGPQNPPYVHSIRGNQHAHRHVRSSVSARQREFSIITEIILEKEKVGAPRISCDAKHIGFDVGVNGRSLLGMWNMDKGGGTGGYNWKK